MGFPRQKYWSGLTFLFPGDFPDPEGEHISPALAGWFFYYWAPAQCYIRDHLTCFHCLFIFGHCSDWVISITLAFGWLVCSYVSLSLLFISSRLFFKLLKSSCLIGPFLYFLFPCYNIQWLYQIFFLIQLILLLLIFWILYLLNCSFLLHFFPKCFILLFKL